MAHYTVTHSVIALLLFLGNAAPAATAADSALLLHYHHLERSKSDKKVGNSVIEGLSFRPLIAAGSVGLACEMRY